MAHPSEVLFDQPTIDAVEDAYQVRYVRLRAASLDDLPERLHKQLPATAPGVTDQDDDRLLVEREGVPDVTQMVGLVTMVAHGGFPHRHDPEKLSDLRFDVEFGGRPELLTEMRLDDLVQIDAPTDEMGEPRLARRQQFADPRHEARARCGEGWDQSVEQVEMERVALDPTGTGEGGVPPLDRASSGQGADQMTKVYLVDRKDAIFVYGELEIVKAQMIASAGRGDWVQLQRVNKDAVVSPDDIVINPAYVVSLQSERL
jgi:hypothetical protein